MIYLARRYGYRWFGFLECSREMLRFTWLEITWRFGLALALCNFDDDDGGHFSLNVHLGFPSIYLKLPFLPRREPKDCMLDKWGFSLDTDCWDAIHFNWGARIVHMPWTLEWYRTSYLMGDGTWLDELRNDRPGVNPNSKYKTNHEHYRAIRDKADTGQWSETYPYTYTLRSGEIQNRQATVTVREAEWRRRWLMWCPLFRKVTKSIEVDFDGEVGERSGSWKGGTIGCGYEMKTGEGADRRQCGSSLRLRRSP